MYRALESRSLDVLPNPGYHFSSITNRIPLSSQSGWPRSSTSLSGAGSNRVDVHNLRQLDLQRQQELEDKHRTYDSNTQEAVNPTRRWLESLDTPPYVDMSASLHMQPSRRNNYELPNGRQGTPLALTNEYVDDQQSVRLVKDRHDSLCAQMPKLSSVIRPSSSEASNIADFLRIPLANDASRENVPGFATSARNDLPVDFAAQMTCLFWFESTSTLEIAEEYRSDQPFPINPARVAKEATPSDAFSKWAATMLSITQVSKSVTLLALLFIYRLKTLCPKVKGKFGSEYRLLTVALMLGNKFLDDNTYTNKTWAEVSHISVAEIHMMEVEFLSNMRYSLLATEAQWKAWQVKLSNFSSFMDAYKQVKTQSPERFCLPRPNVHLPSPNSLQASPPRTNALQQIPQVCSHAQWSAPPVYQSVPMPTLAATPDLYTSVDSNRKRSYDIDVVEPPAKRLQSDYPGTHRIVPQLPVPTRVNFGIPTPAASVHSSFLQNLPSLPLGFPVTPAYTPHPNGAVTPTVQLTNNMYPDSQYGTPTRRTSPLNHDGLSFDAARSFNSSPVSGIFPQSYTMHSPSLYLQHRSSPYRPVRPPHTLLHPPPSAALQNYPGGHDRMHYQPLGRRHDYRSGVLPDYSHGHYMPQQQQWQSLLPQPNFAQR